MFPKKLKIEKITAKVFAPFGKLIDLPRKGFPGPNKNLWKIIVRQPKAGWRIAVLVVRDRAIKRLERHPGSLESFEPMSGESLLFVALKKDPGIIRCFLLDKPVILKKGLWHGVITLTREADIKITENSQVKCEYWRLDFELNKKNISARMVTNREKIEADICDYSR
jgi:ureidoglycolate hydrolase